MDTKLTLVIEEEVIQQAKIYAKQNNRSLSDIVENYLKSLLKKASDKDPESSVLIDSLKGSFKSPDDFDYKEELKSILENKHL